MDIDINNLGDVSFDVAVEGRHPLLHFKGKFQKITGEYKTRKQEGKEDSQYIDSTLAFSDVEVIKSRADAAYPFPTTEIKCAMSESAGSQYGVLTTSIAKIMGRRTKFAELYNKEMELEFTSGHIVQRPDDKGNWRDVDASFWEVKSIEGVGSATVSDNGAAASSEDLIAQAVEIANGKNIKAIAKVLLQSSELPSELTNLPVEDKEEEYFDGLVASGELSKDDKGVYHKA